MTEPTPDSKLSNESQPAIEPGSPASPSKRRLIRAGAAAVPVIATLTSRPAQAWSCRTPSAWGSLQANPNTSLKNNAGHNQYTDETWTISNWCNNLGRSGVVDVSTKPWVKLKSVYPSIDTTACRTAGVFDCKKVTVDMLKNVCGIQIPTGVSGSTMACTLFAGTGFGSYCLAAQLNLKLLASSSSNDIERCVTLANLKAMAIVAYPPAPAVAWSQTNVIKFLNDNYIVRAS